MQKTALDPTVSTTTGDAGPSWLTPPVGTRDFLPPEASERRALSRTLQGVFASYGYALVTTPPFERIDVLERVGTLRASEVLQFVDGDTGEVAVFRPDITPQIARLVATRMRDRPPPYRLAYEGHVIRRKTGRARRQRQIAQAGLECIGLPGVEGETEILEIAVRALERAGLTAFTVELALVPLVRQLLEGVAPRRRAEATLALARKDAPALRAALQGSADPATSDALRLLIDLFGDVAAIGEARRALAGHPRLLGELDALERLVEALRERGLGARLSVDLGEVRGFGYYTGPSFALLAEGPGEPLGSGGRYDDLLGRFGHPAPGAGFALDLDHVAWALREATPREPVSEIDAALIASDAPARGREIAGALRERGLRVAILGGTRDDAAAWARAWGVPHLLEVREGEVLLDGTRVEGIEPLSVALGARAR